MRLTASKNAKLGLFVYDYEGIGTTASTIKSNPHYLKRPRFQNAQVNCFLQ